MCLIASQSFLQNAALAVFMVIGAIGMLFWLWMAVDCLVNEPEATQKSGWLLAIVFGSWIGALFYFFVRRRERLNPDRFGTSPTMPTASSRPPPQFGSAGIAMDAEVVPASQVPPLAAPSSVARPSDWTLLRLLLVIVGVVIVLPMLLGVVMYAVMIVMTISHFRQDQRDVATQRQAADQQTAEFKKRAAERRQEFQKRAAEQGADIEKRIAEQEAEFQKRVAEQQEEFNRRAAEFKAAQKNFFKRAEKAP